MLTAFAATSNDPWGPTGTDMSEIAQLTFNKYGKSSQVMRKANHAAQPQ
jgi:hypothetical protein